MPTDESMAKSKALELANQHQATPDKVVERAAAYHAFLSGAATVANKTPATSTTAASGATGNKGAATGGKPSKPAATKTTTPPGGAPKLPQGQHNAEQVKEIILKVVATAGLGKAAANDILDEEAGGARNLKDLKPGDYDKVYEACENALQGGEGGEAAGAGGSAEDDLLG